MRLVLLICASFLCVSNLYAQDSLVHINPRNILDKLDSIKLDSIKNPVNPDSLNGLLNKPQQQVDQYTSKLNKLQSRLTSKIDSLNKLPNPDKGLVKSLDSLRGQIDSLKQNSIIAGAKDKTAKVLDAEQKITSKIESIEGKVNEKLNLFNKNGGNAGGLNLPKVPGVNGIENPLGKVNTGDIKLPTADLPNANLPDTNLPNTNLPDVNLPKANIGLDKIDDVKGLAGEKIGDVTGNAGGYVKDAKEIATNGAENLKTAPDAIEKKLTGLDEVQNFQKDVAPAMDYTEMMKKWNSDPDVARELALNKAKEQAVNHFAGHEEQLKAAMNKLSAAKEKYHDGESVIDMFKKPENPMKGKPFVERLVPGIALQVQASSTQWFDFYSSVGYRWTGRITTGIGWMDRLSTDFKHRRFVASERAYGPRSYVTFKIKSGFHARAEAELINAKVTSPYLLNGGIEPNTRTWVWSYFAGMMKTFTFSKYVTGNVQLLYNIYDPMKRSPYLNRLSVRMGFDFPIKKKVKKG